MAGNVVSNVKKYYGGQVPVPGQGDSDGKVKVLVEKTTNVEIEGVQTDVDLLYDADDLTVPVTPQKLGQWTDENYLIAFKKREDDGHVKGFILYALETDSTSADTLVNRAEFIAFKENMAGDPGASAYEFTMVEDSATLSRYLQDENGEVTVKFNLSSVEPGEQSGYLSDLIGTDSPYMDFEIVRDEEDNAYLNLNADDLDDELEGITERLDTIEGILDELPSDDHGYFNSSLVTTPGDGTTTNIVIDNFRISEGRSVNGDNIEFVQTHQEGGIDFGEVYLNPGTYILNVHYTLQWVGNPRGTFLPLVANVGEQPFDFSYEHEDILRSTRIVTRTTRGKFGLNFPFDADTPPMGIWVKYLEIAQIASYNHPAVTHDSTLAGSGQIGDPLGVTTDAFGKVKDIPTSISQFRNGDVIPVDGPNGPAKMPAKKLLELTAQNALAGNVAPAFDPTRTSENPYKSGESVVYNGKTYTFKVNHYGAWAAADVYVDDSIGISSKIASKRPLTSCNLCHGNVGIGTNGWTRASENAGKNRAYIDIDHPIHLEAGDVAYVDGKVFGDTTWAVYVGIRAGSVYTYKEWTHDCLVKATGPTDVIYLFLFSNETTLSDDLLGSIASSVCISVKAPDVPAPVVVEDIFSLQLRKGTYDFYYNSMNYANSSTRITPAEYHYVELKAGDIVGAPGCRLWLTYFGKNITFEPVVSVSNTGWRNNSYAITDDGVYAFIVDGGSYQNCLKQLYIERSGLKVTFGKYVPVVDIPVDASLFHIGYNAAFSPNRIPLITTNSKRACTFPNRPVKVNAGDTIIVNLDSAVTPYGVYMQFVNATTGATTDRSWSLKNYTAPADGYVHMVVEFADSVFADDYPSIIKDAFKLETPAAFLNVSMAAKDEKTIKLPVKCEMFHPKEGIAHRGFSTVAPENTLPAYRLAYQNGFKWVECDVQYTSDGVAVLCHDATIDRTSSGSGTLSSYTLEQLREFDFGSWKSADYTGTPIPTLEDFLMCCNRLGLNAVIDFSNTNTPNVSRLYAMFELIVKCGMSGRVMFLTTDIKSLLAALISYGCDTVASVSYLVDNITNVASPSMLALKEYKKKGYAVSLSTSQDHITDIVKAFCRENDIFVNAYTANSEAEVEALSGIGCIAFITSNSIVAQDCIKVYELEKACTDL